MNGTLPPVSLLVMKVADDLHRFTYIQYSDSNTGWTARNSVFFSSQGQRSFHKVQTGSVPSPRPMNVADFLAEIKRPGRKADHLTPSSVGVENT
jgi:hypothetical protein